jgi:plasmid stabilization system protein ParE
VRVKLTLAARQDIVEIVKWIAQENPIRAKSFGKALLASCRSLKDFPDLVQLLLVSLAVKYAEKCMATI